MSRADSSHWQIVSRVAASLLGGYVFVWGFVTLGTVIGVALGMSFEQAQTLLFLLAFLLFVVAFSWAFVAGSAARVWAVLGGGGAAMTAAAWFWSQALL